MSTSNPNNPIRIGVAGLGRAGWLIHLNELKGDARFRVVAVTDWDADRRQEAIGTFNCQAFASLPELLRESDCEVVVVATPTVHHFSDASLVMESGRHCVLEKPMASTYAEACRLGTLARRSKGSLFIHHQQPFRAEFTHLREIMASERLGPIFHLEAYWTRYARRWDWQTLKKNGGGQLNNHGSHALSMVLPLLDSRVTHVTADLRNIKDAGDAEDHVHLFLKTESGRTASITVTSVNALPAVRWTLLGSRGSAHCDGESSHLRYYSADSVPSIRAIDAAAPDRAYQSEQIPWEEEHLKVSDSAGQGSFYSNVHAVIREGNTMKVTPDDALEIMRVANLARQDAAIVHSALSQADVPTLSVPAL